MRDYVGSGNSMSNADTSYSPSSDYNDDSLFLGEDSGDGNSVSLSCGTV